MWSTDFPGGSDSKESSCNARDWVCSLVGKIPWRMAWQPTPVFLPEESSWIEEPGRAPALSMGCTESDMTNRISTSESESRSVVSGSLRPHGLYSPWNSPGQNTGVGSLSLLQGIFPTQGLNPGLPHCKWVNFQLSHKRSKYVIN